MISSYSRREYIRMNIVAVAPASSLLTNNLLLDGGTKACQPPSLILMIISKIEMSQLFILVDHEQDTS